MNIADFLNKLSGMSKAVIGAGLVGGESIIIVLKAIVAAVGIGILPNEAILQNALVDVLWGLGAGFLIWLVPNFQLIKPIDQAIEENFEGK